MKDLWQKIIGGILILYMIATVTFFIPYYNWQYAKTHGFKKWLFLGEVAATAKAIVWPYFVFARSATITSSVKSWWLPEYPTLVKMVSNTKNHSLSTNYRTGPQGTAEVKLTLIRKNNGGLILKINLPPQAIFSIDQRTGEKQPSLNAPVIIIRDHNEDGMPDDFNIEPSGDTLYKETFTEDGFIKFRSGPDHQSIWMQWSIAIGFSVNHFLYDFDSALPRK